MFKKFGYNEDKMEKITKNNPKNLTHFLARRVFVQTQTTTRNLNRPRNSLRLFR
jgi:hypothetical protein